MTTSLRIDTTVFEEVPKHPRTQIVEEMEAIIADLERQKQQTNALRNRVILLMSKIEGGGL